MTDFKKESQDAAEAAADKAVREARLKKNDTEGAIEQYRNQVRRVQDDFLSEVREKPLRTLGIAAMIGFAVGAIWKT